MCATYIVRMYVRTYVCVYVCKGLCVCVCVSVCLSVCMYVCMCVIWMDGWMDGRMDVFSASMVSSAFALYDSVWILSTLILTYSVRIMSIVACVYP